MDETVKEHTGKVRTKLTEAQIQLAFQMLFEPAEGAFIVASCATALKQAHLAHEKNPEDPSCTQEMLDSAQNAIGKIFLGLPDEFRVMCGETMKSTLGLEININREGANNGP